MRARARRARRRDGPDPAAPRGAGVRRPARHGHRPGHPVRPHPHPRRAAGRPLRARRGGRRSWPRSGSALGLQRVPLEIVECPDRRLTEAARRVRGPRAGRRRDRGVACCSPTASTEGIWHRVLHDKTADAILEQVSQLPHANVTSVPFQFELSTSRGAAVGAHRGDPQAGTAGGAPGKRGARPERRRTRTTPPSSYPGRRPSSTPPGASASPSPVGSGRSGWPPARRPDPRAGPGRRHRLDLVVFLGRRALAGVEVGTRMIVEGTVGVHKTRLAINPTYQLLA